MLGPYFKCCVHFLSEYWTELYEAGTTQEGRSRKMCMATRVMAEFLAQPEIRRNS